MNLVESLERQMLKPDVPDLRPGDTVKVHVKIVEGDEKKRVERIQVFQGTVISVTGGGINTRFTVRRIAAHGIGVERAFLLHSPRIDKIEIVRRAKVRRAKLHYLRGLSGKKARLQELRPGQSH